VPKNRPESIPNLAVARCNSDKAFLEDCLTGAGVDLPDLRDLANDAVVLVVCHARTAASPFGSPLVRRFVLVLVVLLVLESGHAE
jgi:hypothetical protein